MLTNKRKIWLILSIAILTMMFLVTFAISGCKQEAASGETAAETMSEEESDDMAFEDTELVIQGSDTLLEVSQLWAENFMVEYPDTSISVTGGGSGTGIAALINKTVDLANASRKIKDSEIDQAVELGLDPQEFVVAWDGISVVINKDNPIDELNIEDISKIFTGEITNWSEVGGNDAEIVITSRDSSSGTFEYFKERVVQLDGAAEDNDYSQTALFLASNSAIREEVSTNVDAIGYIGLGYLDDTVKALGVIAEGSDEAVEPSIENVQNGTYPISRPLHMYAPDSDLTDLEQAFLDFVMGDEGQAIALDVGFVPVS